MHFLLDFLQLYSNQGHVCCYVNLCYMHTEPNGFPMLLLSQVEIPWAACTILNAIKRHVIYLKLHLIHCVNLFTNLLYIANNLELVWCSDTKSYTRSRYHKACLLVHSSVWWFCYIFLFFKQKILLSLFYSIYFSMYVFIYC